MRLAGTSVAQHARQEFAYGHGCVRTESYRSPVSRLTQASRARSSIARRRKLGAHDHVHGGLQTSGPSYPTSPSNPSVVAFFSNLGVTLAHTLHRLQQPMSTPASPAFAPPLVHAQPSFAQAYRGAQPLRPPRPRPPSLQRKESLSGSRPQRPDASPVQTRRPPKSPADNRPLPKQQAGGDARPWWHKASNPRQPPALSPVDERTRGTTDGSLDDSGGSTPAKQREAPLKMGSSDKAAAFTEQSANRLYGQHFKTQAKLNEARQR